MRCTAKSKATGEQCRRSAVNGYKVCTVHGGKTPRGAASPHFKTGRWSKNLPTKLAAIYGETANDTELLSVRQDIRLIDALIVSNFEMLDTGESADAWDLMRTAVDKLEIAIDRQDYGGVGDAIRKMRDVIDMRVAHFATEEEIRSKLEQRRKLVETEQKIATQGDKSINAEQLMLLMGMVLNVINNVITDREQRHQIAIGLEKLIAQPSYTPIDRGA